MDINSILIQLKQERPHLQSPLELYEKVLKFCKNCEKVLKEEFKEVCWDKILKKILDEFSTVFEIPYEFISFLNEAILKSNKNPFNEPKIIWELPVSEEEGSKEEIKRMLFILSKPFFYKFRENFKPKKRFEDIGRCPVCGEPISLSVIDEENKRHIICTVCGHEEETFRIGCTYCLHKDCEKIDLLVDEEEIRVELCKSCNSYIKSVRQKDEVYVKYSDPHLIDIISLPLDVVAQQRGFIRRSPNIIGIREIH
jgi:FdhE protein